MFETAPYPATWVETRLRLLCEELEIIRAALGGQSIQVMSGYRDPEYNRAIGGATRSQHMDGRAADIVVSGRSPAQVHAEALQLHQEGKIHLGGLGAYPGFTHVDIRPSARLVRWTGSRKDG